MVDLLKGQIASASQSQLARLLGHRPHFHSTAFWRTNCFLHPLEGGRLGLASVWGGWNPCGARWVLGLARTFCPNQRTLFFVVSPSRDSGDLPCVLLLSVLTVAVSSNFLPVNGRPMTVRTERDGKRKRTRVGWLIKYGWKSFSQ